jgi:polar amino acid transport system substrate-binding protein
VAVQHAEGDFSMKTQPRDVSPFLFALLIFMMAFTASADVMQTIKSRGKLIVGVKADYRPYGFRDANGNIVGLEVDLAVNVAEKLGVELELIPVVSANRIQFLRQGAIDLLIATMADRPDRREAVHIVDPPYYSSGTNLLSRRKTRITAWEDLRKQPVCGIEKAFYNRKIRKTFGAKILQFKGTAEVLDALDRDRCVAFVYDDSFIASKLLESPWSEDYEMPLETIDDNPWGLAVTQGEKDFAAFMSKLVEAWHRTGLILELETNYGLANTPYAKRMHARYSGTDPNAVDTK